MLVTKSGSGVWLTMIVETSTITMIKPITIRDGHMDILVIGPLSVTSRVDT